MIRRLCNIDSIDENLMKKMVENSYIDPKIYDKYDVKRGLRNSNGTGVLAGITNVASLEGYEIKEGNKIPAEGKLYYRGIDIQKLTDNIKKEDRFGFEETIFLLLFGEQPSKNDLEYFETILDKNRGFPSEFIQDILLKTPSKNIMNNLQRAVLSMHSFDEKPDSIDLENSIIQSLNLISKVPSMIAYSHQVVDYYYMNESLVIHNPIEGKSTAENFLHMIREDGEYSPLEAKLLDLCLIVHADHGGGNNSAFATHVVSSSGTDIYSAISAAIGSLKGPKHGGANLMVMDMIEDIKGNSKWEDEKCLEEYLRKILDKKAFNGSGLIYGMGHAVYTISDPRTLILKDMARDLARDKNMTREFNLIENIENISKKIFKNEKNRDICANVDLYSGFIYKMMGINSSLFTPIFAMSRLGGWCAHRIEQIRDDKIIRPAYLANYETKEYTRIDDRKNVIYKS